MTMPGSRAAGLAAIVAVIAASGAFVPAATVASAPHCFGAAARDARHPCNNRRLRFMVRPRPSMAQITPNAPCERVRRLRPGASGARSARARGKAVDTIALIGDSHASHWGAAVEVAARAKRWHGLSITNGICPVSKTPWLLPQPELSQCIRWNRAVLGWLARHPKVTTVFQLIASEQERERAPRGGPVRSQGAWLRRGVEGIPALGQAHHRDRAYAQDELQDRGMRHA